MNAESETKPTVLVTGSAGLIGSHITRALSRHYTMVGMDVKAPERQFGDDFIPCDLTKNESVTRAVETLRARHGNRLASVFHLAAYYDFSGEDSELYDKLTVQGTARLLRALRGFHVEQFVFSSTILVMAPGEEGETLTEFSPLAEDPWNYPRSKIETERLLQREHGEIPVVILRIAGVYDEYGRAMPIAQQISRIYQKQFESYFFPGNANHGQAFVHLEDLIDCCRGVVAHRAVLDPVEIFLIAEPDLVSYRELQNDIGRMLYGKEWTTIRMPKFVGKAGAWAKSAIPAGEGAFIKPWMIDLADDHYPVSIEHARSLLGWEPRHRLRSTLPNIIDNLKRDPVRWFQKNNLPVPDQARQKHPERPAA